VDLDQTATWLHQTGNALQSGFGAARDEIGSRIASFTSRPVSVAQASQEATSARPDSDEIVERAVNDLSRQVDQVRAANEGSARDLSLGIERLRSSADQNQRELVAKLVQLAERVERVERQAAAATAPVVSPPVVQPTTAAPAKPVAKAVPQPVHETKPVQQPTPAAKAKVAPRQTSTETKPGMDAKGIANWTVRDVFDDTAVLEGPRGFVAVGPGDSIPGIGQVQAIMRSGRLWVVATTKGVITPQ
jgi:hypothetical protein